MSERTINATATHEKAVLSAARPIARKAMPRMRKTVDVLRLLGFIVDRFPYFKDLISEYGDGSSNKADDSLFKVALKNERR